MSKRARFIIGVILFVTIILLGALVNRPGHPAIKLTSGKAAEGLKIHLEQRFQEILFYDDQVSMFDTWTSNRLDQVAVGDAFIKPGNDGNYQRFVVSSIEKDGITFDYISHFDHRTWGRALIEEDTGTIKLNWTRASSDK